MKRILKMVLFMMICIAMLGNASQMIDAHPGRTDAYGCHTCRTNCSKWGLSQGEYHCHNGDAGASSGSNSSDTYQSQQEEKARQQQAAEAEKQRQEQAAAERQRQIEIEAEKQRQIEIENEKQREIQKKTDIAEGKENGYKFKNSNPDSELIEELDKNENYMEGYRTGFKEADNELIQKTNQLADTNAKKDASILPKVSDEIPAGVKKALYITEYKEKFIKYENLYFDEIKLDARHSAQIDVYNGDVATDYSSEIEEKGRAVYQQAYSENYKAYTEEIENAKKSAEKVGYLDGVKLHKQSAVSYEEYEKYTVYKVLNEVYNEAYERGKLHNMILMGIIGIIFLFVLWFIFKSKRKRRFFGKIIEK